MSTDEGDSRNQEGSGVSGVTTDDKSMKVNDSGSNGYKPTTTKTTEESTVATSIDEGDSRNREGSGASDVTTDDKTMKANQSEPPNSSTGNGGGSGTLNDLQSDNNNEDSGGESYIMPFEYIHMTKGI